MRRRVLVIAMSSAALLVSGCKSAAVTAQGTTSASAAASASAAISTAASSSSTPSLIPSPTPSKKKYGFGLPSGPTAPGPELLVYTPLRAGDCAAAQTSLGAPDQNGNWSSLPDPAKVLLFQAGVAACTGDLTTAGSLLALDRTLFGATTTEDPQQADSACPALSGVGQRARPGRSRKRAVPDRCRAGVAIRRRRQPDRPAYASGRVRAPSDVVRSDATPSASPSTSPTPSTSHVIVHPSLIIHPLVTPSATS